MKEQIMREAGIKLRDVFQFVISELKPGVLLSDIDNKVASMLDRMEARSALKMLGFPGHISMCLNTQVIQGIPRAVRLEPSDLISIDMTLYYNGFFVDKAVSVVLEPGDIQKNYLVHAVNKCLETGIMNVKPGVKVSSIGNLISVQADLLRVEVGKEFYGHGIGESHHMPPLIPNFNNQSDAELMVGDFITIEPVIFSELYLLRRNDYEVTSQVLSAHAEETLLVTENGAEVIT